MTVRPNLATFLSRESVEAPTVTQSKALSDSDQRFLNRLPSLVRNPDIEHFLFLHHHRLPAFVPRRGIQSSKIRLPFLLQHLKRAPHVPELPPHVFLLS